MSPAPAQSTLQATAQHLLSLLENPQTDPVYLITSCLVFILTIDR